MEVIDYKQWTSIKRIPFNKKVQSKDYMCEHEVADLLSSKCVVEEKLDGTTRWEVINNQVVFYEDMHYKHSIHYTRLPGFNVVFDVWNPTLSGWMNRIDKAVFCYEIGLSVVPLVFEGKTSMDELVALMDGESVFADSRIEGLVIKNYRRGVFGKMVNPEFEDGIDENWLRKRRVGNWLAKNG